MGLLPLQEGERRMAGITIKIQKGVSIFAGMAAVADAEAKGRIRYENEKLLVTRVDNTYRVYKKRRLKKSGKLD